MDKNIKSLVYFLNYLSKKTKNKTITFEKYNEIAHNLGFENFEENKNLFDFYNDNVEEEVKWEKFDLTPYTSNFRNKIERIYLQKEDPEKFFSYEIDDVFELGYSNRSNYVEFLDNSINITFQTISDEILLNLINLEYNDIINYHSAKYGSDCYDVEYSDEELGYIFQRMDTDCVNILKKIIMAFGDIELANRLNVINYNVSEEIVKIFKKFTGDEYLDKLFDDYNREVGIASCNSIVEAFESHFNDDVKMYNDNTLEIKYEFFINFLKRNPEISTFSDLKNYNLIDGYDDISQAAYEYEVDYSHLNREYYFILDNMYEDIMDDEDNKERIESIKNFEKLIKNLKFNYDSSNNGRYIKIIKTSDSTEKVFLIYTKNIDFENKKLLLKMGEKKENSNLIEDWTEYRIPFNELSDYVYTEKLHEAIRKYLI